MSDRSVVVRLRAEVAAFKQAFGEATKAVEQTTAATERGGKASQKAGEQADKGAKQAATASQRLVKSAQDQEKAWTSAGVSLTAFGAIATAAFAGSIKAAIDWESAWTGVTKTVNATGPELDKLEGDLRDLTKVLPASHDQIAAVAEAAGQMGIQTGSIAQFTKVMLELGETTNLSADEAATSLGELSNVMKTAPGDIERLGATLVALGNSGNSTEKDILSMATRIAGAGELVGASEGEVLALSSALADLGIRSELGGGVATRVLLKMYSAVQDGGEALQGFADAAGVSSAQFAAAFGDDPIRALDSFAQGLNGVEASGGNVVATLAALGFEGTEDLRVLLSLKGAGDKLTKALDLQAVAWRQATALSAEADKRNATDAARIQIALNQIREDAIDVGTAFLPAVAAMADGIGDLAGAFADLPGPIQATIGAFTGLAGVASLAAGGFLLLFPRVIETVKAFRELQAMSPRIAGGLGRFAVAAAKVGTSIAAASVAISILNKGLDSRDTVTEYTKALQDLQASAKGGSGSVLADLGKAFDRLNNPNAVESLNNLSSQLNKLGGGQSIPDELRARFDLLGQSFADLYKSDPDLAGQRFNEVLQITGATSAEMLDLLPAYRDTLQEASDAQQAAADSGIPLVQSLSGTATTMDEVTEAVQAWRDMVSESDASFIDLTDAYQSVIDKNTEVAQSTADATASSKDSWETYYDGVSVSFDDFLQQLSDQVKAQTDWEQNIKALIGRVSDSTIDYLLELGPKAGPLVADMVNATDGELAKMERLFGQRGTASVAAFVASVEGARAKPKIDVDANTDPGRRGIAAFQAWARAQSTTINFTADLNLGKGWYDVRNHGVKIKRAEGGPVYGQGSETSDSNLALLSHNEHVWSAREVKGAGGHGALTRMRGMARTGSLPAFAGGGTMAAGWRRELRRGEFVGNVTGGLSGAYSVIDRLLDAASELKGKRGKTLAEAAREAEPALRRLYKQAEGIEARLAKATDKAEELAQVRDRVASGLTGGFSFSDAIGNARRFEDTPGGGIKERVDVGAVKHEAHAYARKLKILAHRLDTLRKLGMPASLLQEIAGLGADEGIIAAESWIAAGRGEISSIASAYSSIDKYANLAGTNITKAMYDGGVDAAEGLVEGLKSQQGAIEKQMIRIAESMEKALKKALGIHSPSKKAQDIADNFGATLTGRLGGWEGRVTTASQAMVAGMTRPSYAGAQTSAAAGRAEQHRHYHLDNAAALSYARGVAVEVATVDRRNETAMSRG